MKNWKPGDPIRPGEPLFDLYPPDSQSQDFIAVLKVFAPPVLIAGCLLGLALLLFI